MPSTKASGWKDNNTLADTFKKRKLEEKKQFIKDL